MSNDTLYQIFKNLECGNGRIPSPQFVKICIMLNRHSLQLKINSYLCSEFNLLTFKFFVYCMITQKLVSLKLDIIQLERLDDLCSKLGVNRNKFINFAIKSAVENLQDFNKCLLISAYSKINF